VKGFALLLASALLCRGQLTTSQEPTTVANPLLFSGLSDVRLPLISERAFSWTAVRYTLQGVNVTDAYQPGRMAVFPNSESVSKVLVRSGLRAAPGAYGTEIALSTRAPGLAWHTRLASGGTGSSLASGNLPAVAAQGILQQSEHFRWLTRDSLETGGPLGKRADLLVSLAGQWGTQTVPQARAGEDLGSRMLFGVARGRVHLSGRDQVDAQWSGSRLRLSDWGMPVGLEALAGRRASPSFNNPAGFAGLKEADAFDSLQAGWTRHGLARGSLAVRYGYSETHLDTAATGPATAQSRIDLEAGVVGDTPPLANRAARTRHGLQAAFEPGEWTLAGRRHRFSMGGSWELASVLNRWSAPSNVNLITAKGAPAFVVVLTGGPENRARIQSAAAYVQDTITITPWITADTGVAGDFARGDRIAWNNLSGRVGLALTPLSRLTLRASYARAYAPLAGRYLDFGNPISLGGLQYQWNDQNADGLWQPWEHGALVGRFGGLASKIDSHLRRPYADDFNLAAEAKLPLGIAASLRLFRRDEKDRLATVNVGVPPAAFSPVEILDPGPDSIPGTFDDQRLTVYAQDPATLGHDSFLLTNPAGLRMMYKGLVAEVGGGWRFLQGRVSFMAVKSYGPTNPGNSVIENDAGVVGALFQDPNTAIHAAGRTYFDRAYVAKAELVATLPKRLGGIELANTATYLDGLPFGRRLLVTGLPQGPFLVAATVRGSPEGGNRAEYVPTWNLLVGRTVRVPGGSLRLALDILNMLNSGNKIQESDVSGPLFNQRLPVAIQPPRYARVNIEYLF
jgi:hypothetical protein